MEIREEERKGGVNYRTAVLHQHKSAFFCAQMLATTLKSFEEHIRRYLLSTALFILGMHNLVPRVSHQMRDPGNEVGACMTVTKPDEIFEHEH